MVNGVPLAVPALVIRLSPPTEDNLIPLEPLRLKSIVAALAAPYCSLASATGTPVPSPRKPRLAVKLGNTARVVGSNCPVVAFQVNTCPLAAFTGAIKLSLADEIKLIEIPRKVLYLNRFAYFSPINYF
jgi:hypothetical protein